MKSVPSNGEVTRNAFIIMDDKCGPTPVILTDSQLMQELCQKQRL